jgi:hypothetical protein
MALFAVQPLHTANNNRLGPIRHSYSASMCSLALLFEQRQDCKELNSAVIEHCFKAHFPAFDWVATSFFHIPQPPKKPNLHLNYDCLGCWVGGFAL